MGKEWMNHGLAANSEKPDKPHEAGADYNGPENQALSRKAT